MEISEIEVWFPFRDIKGVHTSHRSKEGKEIIPDSMEDMWNLLKKYSHPIHQNHLGNNYYELYYTEPHQVSGGEIKTRLHVIGYIDLVNLKRKIRDKNIRKLLSE